MVGEVVITKTGGTACCLQVYIDAVQVWGEIRVTPGIGVFMVATSWDQEECVAQMAIYCCSCMDLHRAWLHQAATVCAPWHTKKYSCACAAVGMVRRAAAGSRCPSESCMGARGC